MGNKLIKLVKNYEDSSGERVSISIDEKQNKDCQVMINKESMSLEDLDWLKKSIDVCLTFIGKNDKK